MGPPRCGRLFFAFVRPVSRPFGRRPACAVKRNTAGTQNGSSCVSVTHRGFSIVSRATGSVPALPGSQSGLVLVTRLPGRGLFIGSRGGSPPERVRAISIARLRASPPAHLRPIDVVVSHGPGNGDLILRGASCLDAFSTYPGRRRLPGGAAGATTGAPVLRPTRSSRTSVGASQVSRAHNR